MRNTKFMALALAASVALGLLGAKAVSQQVTNEIQKVRWHRWGWSHPSLRREKLVKDGMLNRL
jgi:hypothetical protein